MLGWAGHWAYVFVEILRSLLSSLFGEVMAKISPGRQVEGHSATLEGASGTVG